MRSLKSILVAIALVYAMAYVGNGLSNALGGTSATVGSVTRGDACFMAQKFVKPRLKSPATATFPLWSESACAVTQDGNTWYVNSYVDAQNGYGAKLRTAYSADLVYHADSQSWTLARLTFAD